MCSKLGDGMWQVQILVTFVDLAVRSFPWFSPKLKYGLGSLRKIPRRNMPPILPGPRVGNMTQTPMLKNIDMFLN